MLSYETKMETKEKSPVNETNAALHLPGGLFYECIQCGRGCEDFEEIRVDPATVERIDRLPMAELMRPEADGSPPPAPYAASPWDEGEYIIRKTGDRKTGVRCCLLTEDKLCAIHCAHGLEAKPLACRSFPFAFRETPGGVYTSVSFACTAVLTEQGPPVKEQESEIRETLRFSPNRRAAPAEIMLAPQLPLSWEQYRRLECDLLEILNGTENVAAGLAGQSIYLRLLIRFLRQTREMIGAEPGERPEQHETTFEKYRKSMADDGRWTRIRRMAGKPRSSRLLRRATLGYVLAFRHVADRRRGPLGSAAWVLTTYMRHAFGRGAVTLPRRPEPVPYEAMRRIQFDPTQPDQRRLLKRFFAHCLFRKDLLMHEEIDFAHNLMLMNYGFIHWYGAALASAAGHERIEMEDLIEAVRTVEQNYGQHSVLPKLFQRHPKLKAIMESLFHRPLFPYAMTETMKN